MESIALAGCLRALGLEGTLRKVKGDDWGDGRGSNHESRAEKI